MTRTEILLSRVHDQNAQELLAGLLEGAGSGLSPEFIAALEKLEGLLSASAEQARTLTAALERVAALEAQVLVLQEWISNPENFMFDVSVAEPAPLTPTEAAGE